MGDIPRCSRLCQPSASKLTMHSLSLKNSMNWIQMNLSLPRTIPTGQQQTFDQCLCSCLEWNNLVCLLVHRENQETHTSILCPTVDLTEFAWQIELQTKVITADANVSQTVFECFSVKHLQNTQMTIWSVWWTQLSAWSSWKPVAVLLGNGISKHISHEKLLLQTGSLCKWHTTEHIQTSRTTEEGRADGLPYKLSDTWECFVWVIRITGPCVCNIHQLINWPKGDRRLQCTGDEINREESYCRTAG